MYEENEDTKMIEENEDKEKGLVIRVTLVDRFYVERIKLVTIQDIIFQCHKWRHTEKHKN